MTNMMHGLKKCPSDPTAPKHKQRNDPVLNISFSEAVDYINFEESSNALKGPYIRVPDYVCDKDFTDEDFHKWVMSL
ncbi:hypothetical protein [Shewanella xiamenensis]|uniref:hypothetical protein n=1 Tax=Shewanella xiamenensis TaxID=332186 RepID=UPI0021C19809|nr:hypothetical protein [Shewanella xiamenensis]MCT8876649.1 hypothetical protein [Shewanella xiamenensis]